MAVLLMLLCLPLFGVAKASVHHYNAQKFIVKSNSFVVHGGIEGIYGSSNDSFIRFENITVRRLQVSSNSCTRVHAILFETTDRETIGDSAYGGQRAVCCTLDLAKLGVCEEKDIIHRQSTENPGWPQLFSVSFEVGETEATFTSSSIQITKTGMYTLYFIHCDPGLKDAVVEGKTIWKNPTGYLPGETVPLLKFYRYMSLAFVSLGIFWFSRCGRFCRVLPFQNSITLVIAVGILEMALWYLDYAVFNGNGVRPMGITFWALLFGTIKRIFSRLIILVVSMGYGLVTPVLGGMISDIVMVGALFTLVSDLLEFAENIGVISDHSEATRLFLFLPVGLLEVRFIFLIFFSVSTLSVALNMPQDPRLMAKLDMYRKFTNAVRVAAVVSLGGICYEVYFKSNDVYIKHWKNAWIIPAIWEVLLSSLLCVICILWAPSPNSRRYAHPSDEHSDGHNASTLISPAPAPSSDIRSPSDTNSLRGSNGLSNGDAEVDKTA